MGNKGLAEETREQHESYGMVVINRSQSSGTYLFGSIANHHSFISLTIKKAERIRHLAQDWYHASSMPIVEIEMSHTQFAELITSPGIGDGVPCTIRALDGKLLAKCPPPENVESKYAEDLKKTTKETVGQLKQLVQQLEQASLPGEKPLNKTEQKLLLSNLKSALQSVVDSIPFIETQFNEHMEETRDKMIGEVEAVATHMLINLGKEALVAKNMLPGVPTPQLTEGKDK